MSRRFPLVLSVIVSLLNSGCEAPKLETLPSCNDSMVEEQVKDGLVSYFEAFAKLLAPGESLGDLSFAINKTEEIHSDTGTRSCIALFSEPQASGGRIGYLIQWTDKQAGKFEVKVMDPRSLLDRVAKNKEESQLNGSQSSASEYQSRSIAQSEHNAIKTKAGILSLDGEDGYRNLTIDDKVLLENVLGVDLIQHYVSNERDVLILSVSTGANGACPIDYYFLTVANDSKVNLSPPISCHHEAELKTETNGTRIVATIQKSDENCPDSNNCGLDEYFYENGILFENGKKMEVSN